VSENQAGGCDVWWLCVVVMTVERVLQVRLKFAWAAELQSKSAIVHE
jgi:hypothetical protein